MCAPQLPTGGVGGNTGGFGGGIGGQSGNPGLSSFVASQGDFGANQGISFDQDQGSALGQGGGLPTQLFSSDGAGQGNVFGWFGAKERSVLEHIRNQNAISIYWCYLNWDNF